MTQIIGIIAGFLAGSIWEYLSTTPFEHFITLLPSLFVKHSRETLHIHHWIFYFLALIIISAIAYKTNRLNHPAVLFINSLLLGALLYNFYEFPDWYKFTK